MLKSKLFRGDSRLEKCAVNDPDHVKPGDSGPFVAKIQYAVLVLQGGSISGGEIQGQRYGTDTAKVVLEYKSKRRIINTSYQSTADDIVGKMTIRSLDTEMSVFEAHENISQSLQQ